jgi:hypothetical protein
VMMVKEQGRKSTYFPGSLKGVGKWLIDSCCESCEWIEVRCSSQLHRKQFGWGQLGWPMPICEQESFVSSSVAGTCWASVTTASTGTLLSSDAPRESLSAVPLFCM